MAGRYWREAASLIIIGKAISEAPFKKLNGFAADYNLLLMKRSLQSKFMAQKYAFPGGVLEKADLSLRWLEIFKKKGILEDDIVKIFRHGGNRPECYLNKSPKDDLIPELAFRICALRETFEETGILLVAESKNDSMKMTIPDLEDQYLENWRQSIMGNASKFIELFEDLDKLPAVWSLYEWSNWLTPAIFKSSVRFDTVFFVAFLDHEIPVVDHSNKHEAEEFLAITPFGIFNKQLQEKKVLLAPPQQYEIARLLNFSKMESLKEFTVQRSKMGLSRFVPSLFKTLDGPLSVLPGDDLYPKDINYLETQEPTRLDATQEELLQSGRHFHRNGEAHSLIVENVTPDCGHINPITFKSLLTKSKL